MDMERLGRRGMAAILGPGRARAKGCAAETQGSHPAGVGACQPARSGLACCPRPARVVRGGGALV